jgi:hypothetical protein
MSIWQTLWTWICLAFIGAWSASIIMISYDILVAMFRKWCATNLEADIQAYLEDQYSALRFQLEERQFDKYLSSPKQPIRGRIW